MHSNKIFEVQVIASLAMVAASVCGQAQSQTAPVPQATFAVASVRLSSPDTRGTSFSRRGAVTFTATNATLTGLLAFAFGVSDAQVVGLPRWAETTHYDVIAKPVEEKPLDEQQFQQALQQLLQERLHLSVHHKSKPTQGYRLVTAKSKLKLPPSQGGYPGRAEYGVNSLWAPNVTLQQLCHALVQTVSGAPVMDATGIKGSFEIKLEFARDEDTASSFPSVFTAIQEQLGLRLVAAKVPLDTIVVDHVERDPTPN